MRPGRLRTYARYASKSNGARPGETFIESPVAWVWTVGRAVLMRRSGQIFIKSMIPVIAALTKRNLE